MAHRIREVFASKKLADYSALLVEDLVIDEDGLRVGASRDECLARFGLKFVADGALFTLAPGFVGGDRLLSVESFNSAASWGRTPPPHCCWRYDAVSYRVRDSRIVAIQRLTGGEMSMAESPPVDGK